MKFISNKQYDTIFSYFPGVDTDDSWTLQSPAIYHRITDGNSIYIPNFINRSSEPKYLLFKLNGDINYELSLSSTNYSSFALDIELYDFLNRDNDDVKDSKNFIIKKEITNIQTLDIYVQSPELILAKISPLTDSDISVNKNITLCFSNKLLEFDYTSHMVRDWKNRVDGSRWDISGKVNSIINFQKIQRRHSYDINYVPVWKNGIYIYALSCSHDFNSYENMEKYFCDFTDDMYEIRNSANFYGDSVLGYHSNVIIKMLFLYYNTKDAGYYNFYFNGYGQIGISVNGINYYSKLNYSPSIYLQNGYNQFIIYYNINSNYYYNTPRLIIYKQNRVLQNNEFFIPNEYDYDKYVSFNKIFQSVCSQTFFDGYIHLNKESSFAIFNDNVGENCTISFWIRFKQLKNVKEIPYNIIRSQNLSISRVSQNKLRIKNQCDLQDIEYEFTLNEWHHICLSMSPFIISYYFDLQNNGYHQVNNYTNYDDNYMVGKLQKQYAEQYSGQFDIYDVIISKKCMKQYQVNRIYNNVI